MCNSTASVFASAFLGRLVGFVEDLHEVLGHEVGLLEGAVVPLQVLHCWKRGTLLTVAEVTTFAEI